MSARAAAWRERHKTATRRVLLYPDAFAAPGSDTARARRRAHRPTAPQRSTAKRISTRLVRLHDADPGAFDAGRASHRIGHTKKLQRN
ncbi:hypothetical protein WS68_04140 [Burkholderia sp. TSV86]|nr:hypothetical protein WS68_04140 [Burkholderia sp. TSV86]